MRDINKNEYIERENMTVTTMSKREMIRDKD